MSDNTIVLDTQEQQQVRELADMLTERYGSFDNSELLANMSVFGHQLPSRLVTFLNGFRYGAPRQGYCVVSGLPVDLNRVGPTPPHWQLESNNDRCMDSVMSMCLCSSILGDIFGWLTQQDGRLVHDVVPIEKHRHEQLGSGSEEELCMHTEDAFHELRGDYILLMCLRNPHAVPTTLSRPDYSKLTQPQIDALFEPAFTIRPDNSHKCENESESRAAAREALGMNCIEEAYGMTAARDENPAEVSVLFGSRENPYLRIDPYYMGKPKTAFARDALDALVELIDESTIEVSLSPGECVIVDNFVSAHGRRPFKANYDGSDRWLKRLNVVRDIRKYNEVLENPTSRVIY